MTSSTVDDRTPAARRAAAVPPVEMISQPSCDQALGEGDDPALVADRDQRARHDEPVTDETPRFREAGPDGRRGGGEDHGGQQPVLRPRAPARPAARACRRAAPAPGPGPRIAPRSYSSSTRCTVAPLSRAPLGQHRLVHPAAVHALAAEGRKQRGVDVDDAAAIAGDDRGGHQLEVAGQDEQIDPVPLQRLRATRRRRPDRGSTSAGNAARRGARSSAGASARLLSTSTTRAGASGPSARSSASRLLPRPETATATRIVMAGEGNRRRAAGRLLRG